MYKRWFQRWRCDRCGARSKYWAGMCNHHSESRACYYAWMMKERIIRGHPPLPMLCVAAHLPDEYLEGLIDGYYGKEEAKIKIAREFEIALEMGQHAQT